MSLPSRLLALLLLTLVLATSTGVEPGCSGSAPAPAEHQGGHHPDAPTRHHHGHPCPVLPGAACLATAGCLPASALPTAQPLVLTAERSAQPATAPLPALLPRDITPASPPPRT